jgi:uncharacterized protein YnzC (UPF0291/DUF896 family)
MTSLKQKFRSKVKIPKKFFEHSKYHYNKKDGENVNLINNENDNDNDNGEYIIQSHCLGFIKRRIKIRIRPLMKKTTVLSSQHSKRNKSDNIESKLSELEHRQDMVQIELEKLEEKLISKNIIFQPLSAKDKENTLTMRERTHLSKLQREIIKMVAKKRDLVKRVKMFDTAINNVMPAVMQSDNITDLKLITSVMKSAGKINSNIQTEQLIKEAQYTADQMHDMQLTQEELDDVMNSTPTHLDNDAQDELDEIFGLSPSEERNINKIRNDLINPKSNIKPSDIDEIMNLLPSNDLVPDYIPDKSKPKKSPPLFATLE